MNYLDLTLQTPEENLALDEALLDQSESKGKGEVLRFWQSERHFVVLGLASPHADEVNAEAALAQGVPVLRRVSGGGAVLQGPGCLNFALILKADRKGLDTIRGSNTYVLERNRRAFEALLHQPVRRQGMTDLTLGTQKFSGNAQRRRKHFLLFHGTVLLHLELDLMQKLLPVPNRRPEYRKDRQHKEFLTALSLPPHAIKEAMRGAWNASRQHKQVPLEQTRDLVRRRYGKQDWTWRA